jgi:hypothetical protein
MSQHPDGSTDLDLTILAHLRGYPEELRRFSNLMKQAHSNGRTAAEFFLSRPVAEDSFVVEVCRLVQAGEEIVTVVETAPSSLGRGSARAVAPRRHRGISGSGGRPDPWRDLTVREPAHALDPMRGVRRHVRHGHSDGSEKLRPRDVREQLSPLPQVQHARDVP